MSAANDLGASQGAPLLEKIQKLQFTDKPQAEALLLAFIRETFPQLDTVRVELRPQAISLNSFNGFMTLSDHSQLFFKTHVEQDNVIGEYYNAAMLAEANYPIIQPLYSSTRSDQQIVIYPVVTHPSVFDTARQLETHHTPDERLLAALTRAQNQSDDALYQIYLQTLAFQSEDDAQNAPVHQLFYHRLVGGRLDRFYGDDTAIELPSGRYALSHLRGIHWQINGAHYHETLDDIIHNAITLLKPQTGLSIIGHGDAHNGNVFFDAANHALIYFDPAFAGRHHPLLDLAKPLFHNVFAMWLYFPQEERKQLKIDVEIDGNTWKIQHNYTLNPIRKLFLESKAQRVLLPILQTLKQQAALPSHWRHYLKAALFCCPSLTLDLKQFPPEISLLGLTMAVEMGAESHHQRSVIDQVLDRVENALD